MKHLSLIIALTTLSLVACSRTPVANPDPNHTHADFAVWIDGKRLDFSGPEFMSGTSDENDPDHTKHHKYLHLHDGNGHVIHQHMPGLTIGDFFSSLPWSGSGYRGNIYHLADSPVGDERFTVRLFVNGIENSKGASYVFSDGDHVLITNATDDAEVKHELSLMTNDACLYSKTCPWRGDPPTENCIADPEVPCKI